MNAKAVGSAAIIAAAVALASDSRANVRFVDDDAPPGGDGLTWTSAYRFLQDAIAEALDDPGVTEIRVAQGVYKPDEDDAGLVMPGDREATFQLYSGLTLVGGFAGSGAPNPNRRDDAMFETILSGDLLDDDRLGFVGYEDNSYHVVSGSFTGASAVIDGVTIKAGNADGNYDEARGAGIYIKYGSPTVRSCVFTENLALAGGAMFVWVDSSPLVSECEFLENAAINGGGAVYNLHSSAAFVGCAFVRNSAFHSEDTLSPAGAMYNGYGEVLVQECSFIENTASVGGAIANDSVDSFAVTDSSFIGNICSNSHGWGGAIKGGAGRTDIQNCTFIGNAALGEYGRGGAITTFGYPLHSIRNCQFISNSAGQAGGAVWCFASDEVEAVNCVYNGNTAAESGGGIASLGSKVRLFNCTISSNTAGERGGGIWNRNPGSVMRLFNCIAWGNSDSAGEGATSQIYTLTGGISIVVYSCVQGGWGGSGGQGVIDIHPRFRDLEGNDGVAGTKDDDLRLLPTSPCLDVGDNAAVPFDVVTDIDGNRRIAVGRKVFTGPFPIVDMGAYELLAHELCSKRNILQ